MRHDDDPIFPSSREPSPWTPDPPARPAKEPSLAAIGFKRILVVEDDPDLSALLSWNLANDGFRVEVAQGVAEALDKIRGAPFPFDLVISDVRLRAESGIDLLFPDGATARRPRTLMMTAFASRELQSFVEGMGSSLLEKPFSADQLRQTVFDILFGRRERAK
jgi:two-component system alkaline phosphatase synthesis response regulator PhoP